MRRVLGFLFVLAGASSAVASADTSATTPQKAVTPAKPAVHAAAPAKPTVHLAPADEYFGPLKMSVLGIRNEIHDLAIRYDVRADADHALAKQIMGTALMTEASLADLEKKYPADSQLARDVYLMQHLYAKIDYDDARAKAKYCAQWLFSRYSRTWYAKNLHETMAHESAAPAPAPPAAAPAQPQPAQPGGAGSSGSATSETSGTPGTSSATSGTSATGSVSSVEVPATAVPAPAPAPPAK